MKNVSLYLSNKNGIKDIELLNKEDRLIYQDYNGNVFDNGKTVILKANKTKFKKFDILGIDEEDNLYLYNKEEESVFICNNGKLVNSRRLDFMYDKVISKGNSIYLINSKEIFEVINSKTIKIDEAEEIIDILNNKVLYRNTNGKLEIQ